MPVAECRAQLFLIHAVVYGIATDRLVVQGTTSSLGRRIMSARHDGNTNGQGLLFELPAVDPLDRIFGASPKRSRSMAGNLANVALSIETLVATVEAMVRRWRHWNACSPTSMTGMPLNQ
jgi:hypothetical protein